MLSEKRVSAKSSSPFSVYINIKTNEERRMPDERGALYEKT
jgi:hypothetical protein